MKKLATLFLVLLILNSANAKRNRANAERNSAIAKMNSAYERTSLLSAVLWGVGVAAAGAVGGPIGLAAVGYASTAANEGGVVAGGLVAGLQGAGAAGSIGYKKYVAPAETAASIGYPSVNLVKAVLKILIEVIPVP